MPAKTKKTELHPLNRYPTAIPNENLTQTASQGSLQQLVSNELLQKPKKSIALLTLSLVCLLSIGVNGWLIWENKAQKNTLSEYSAKIGNQQKELATLSNDPNTKAKNEVRELMEQVGKLIVLPENEEPTVATVTDLAPLKGQEFFAKAQIGDKVLLFTQSGNAILYRPSEEKIIEKAPIQGSNNQTDQASSSKTGTVAGDSTKNPSKPAKETKKPTPKNEFKLNTTTPNKNSSNN